jgi:hypothetical protein
MKHFLHLLFLLPVFSYAQNDSIIEYSRLVKFIMQPNAFVKITYDTIGSTNDIQIGIVTATSLKDSTKERSVCFSNSRLFNNFVSFNERSMQIPVEDLSAFIDALEWMKKESDLNNVRVEENYRYVSSNYTVLEMENRSYNTKRWDIALYSRFRTINGQVPGSRLVINQRHLGNLLVLLQQLEQKLGSNLYTNL